MSFLTDDEREDLINDDEDGAGLILLLDLFSEAMCSECELEGTCNHDPAR